MPRIACYRSAKDVTRPTRLYSNNLATLLLEMGGHIDGRPIWLRRRGKPSPKNPTVRRYAGLGAFQKKEYEDAVRLDQFLPRSVCLAILRSTTIWPRLWPPKAIVKTL